jgi:outer membrane protein assembly factor BamB
MPPVGAVDVRPRLWPAVLLVVLLWCALLVPPWLAPLTMVHFLSAFLAPIVAAAGLLVWWLFASRVPWATRVLDIPIIVGAGVVTAVVTHPTLSPIILFVYALPIITTAWVGWLLLTPMFRWPVRHAGLLTLVLLTWASFLLVRYDGVNGGMSATFHLRWTPSAEEQYLAERAAGHLPVAPVDSTPVVLQPGDWPGFRGLHRDARLTSVRLATDWNEHPPHQVWRHKVGPGWSSFAVVGGRLYTQEQRGPSEGVVCYDAGTGAEVWSHEDTARFSEEMAGPGPRATPTFHDGRIYALGATGQLNCLDAATGRLIWTHNIADDSGAKLPQWGFASSPLVAEGIVTVFAGGPGGKSVLGYKADSGALAWSAGEGQFSYSSLHPARLGDVDQLLLLSDRGVTAFQPARGEVLWEHVWQLKMQMSRVVQPTVVGDDVLIGTGFGEGTRRIHVRHDGQKWDTQEIWTSRALKPYYNDQVVHGGQVYGFDNTLFTCINLEDGKQRWKTRDYGNGQVLLLADQGLLLVLSEKGEAALVEATPDAHRELGRFQALNGKTWNHPVVAHGKLFVRNGEEAACYELAAAP